MQCLTRWRKSEFENLEPPPAPVAEAGKRRSSRHRAGTQFFTPTFGGPAKHARCAAHKFLGSSSPAAGIPACTVAETQLACVTILSDSRSQKTQPTKDLAHLLRPPPPDSPSPGLRDSLRAPITGPYVFIGVAVCQGVWTDGCRRKEAVSTHPLTLTLCLGLRQVHHTAPQPLQ